MQLSLDRREIRLSHALGEFPHELVELPVGDVVCTYSDGRECWVAERKTASDLAQSIKSGRWADQVVRLHQSNYARIFFLIEGDLRSPQFPYASLMGAVVNAALRPRSIVLRSIDIDETATILINLCGMVGSTPPGVPLALAPPVVPIGKRKRDAELATVWKRQLMCVPSVSEKIAANLLEHFGSLPALVAALNNDEEKFPRIRLDGRSCLGKKRIQLLLRYFRADT